MRQSFIKIETVSMLLLFFAAFFLTLWRFGSNQCIALAALSVLVYRPWREQLFSKAHFKKPIIVATLIFIAWMLISLTYAEVPKMSRAVQGLTMYSKLLFLLVLPLTMTHAKCRYYLEQGLILGVLINVLISTLNYYHVTWVQLLFGPYFSVNGIFSINPLQMIFIVVLACWILAQRMVNRESNAGDMLIFILLSIYLWFINIERSGYLIYLVLFLVLLYQHLNKKGFFIGLICIPILLFGLYEFSPNVKTRVDIGITNITAFHQAQNVHQVASDNSLGMRLTFAKVSLDVIKMHPLLGTGIGSFKYVYAKQMTMPVAPDLNDPHNAYFMIAFELGLIGLALYLMWLGAIFFSIKKLPQKQGRLLQGLWWALVIFGFTDSGLILNAVGLSFVLLLSLYAQKELTT